MSQLGDSITGLIPHSDETLVVLHATPVHYLILIGEIEILRILYGKIAIPLAVAGELSAPAAPLPVRNWIGSMPSWTSVVSVSHTASFSVQFGSLGGGEIEALALPQQSAGSVLLTDDLKARVAAETIGIQTIPKLRILSAAGRLQLLDLEGAIGRLQLTNFRASREVVESVLKRGLIQSPD